MPFTGSHPAAVLPFFRVLVPAALVIGSMTPDLPYFVPSPVRASVTHTVSGFWFDVLLGTFAFAWWQFGLAPAARALAPGSLRARLTPARTIRSFASAGQVLLVLTSVLVGVVTHVGWDEFTHGNRWGTYHIAWLAQVHGPLPGYRWAQYASGVLGAGVLLVAAVRWWRSATPVTDSGPTDGTGKETATPAGTRHRLATKIWAALAAITVAGITAGFVLSTLNGHGIHSALFDAAQLGGGAGLAASLITLTTIRVRQRTSAS